MDIPSEVLAWKFGNIPGNLRATNYVNDQGYNCFCSTNGKYLGWYRGQISINLDYASGPQNKFHFARQSGQGEILTGEPIALAIGGGEAFLRYGSRSIGINLKWSAEPEYEWRIFLPDGQKGKPIPTGTPCALLNVNVDPSPDFLVYLEKHMPKVVDLGWTTSPNWITSYLGGAKEVAKIAAMLAALA